MVDIQLFGSSRVCERRRYDNQNPLTAIIVNRYVDSIPVLANQTDQLLRLDPATCASVESVGMLIYDGETAYLLRGNKEHFEVPNI